MKPMTYKGYAARIEYSDEDELFVGRVVGIRDIITFHGGVSTRYVMLFTKQLIFISQRVPNVESSQINHTPASCCCECRLKRTRL